MTTTVDFTFDNPSLGMSKTKEIAPITPTSSVSDRKPQTLSHSLTSSKPGHRRTESSSGPKQRIYGKLRWYWLIVIIVFSLEVINFIATILYADIDTYTWLPALIGYVIALVILLRLLNSELMSRSVFCRLLREPNVLLSFACVIVNIFVCCMS